MNDLTPLYVVMAKRPEAGLVKSRLVSTDFFTPTMAATLAQAMLKCIVQRLAAHGTVVLAVTPDGCGAALAETIGCSLSRIVDQGSGDLGERLRRVWTVLGEDHPVAFFGMDSPDIPTEALASISDCIQQSDIAIGPTHDGGYWTLAGRQLSDQILTGIDWGTELVYDQTCHRAEAMGLSVCTLSRWFDVDLREDVLSLSKRLETWQKNPLPNQTDQEALMQLMATVHELLGHADIEPVNRIR